MGVPWLLALGCLVAIPVVVYVISYTPWVNLDNQFWRGFPADHGGQDLWGLTLQMYGYHNDLRVPHAASSPWWAWPLNLKPVWYYQDSFAGSTTGEIYDAGNLVVFWMGLPALVFAAVAAWRRRSLALTVDRAAVPRHVAALGTHRPGHLPVPLLHGGAVPGAGARVPRRGAVARAGEAGLAAGARGCRPVHPGPSLMWLLRPVLCAAANTAATEAGAQVCGASVRDVALSQRSVVVLTVLVVAGVALTLALWRAYRAPSSGSSEPWLVSAHRRSWCRSSSSSRSSRWGQRCCSPAMPSGSRSSSRPTRWAPSPSWCSSHLRGSCSAHVTPAGSRWAWSRLPALFLLIWYPNLSGLPLPNGLATAFQGLLPTWTYDFQFAVNRELPEPGGVSRTALVVALVTAVGVVIVMIAARWWHRRPDPVFLDEPA